MAIKAKVAEHWHFALLFHAKTPSGSVRRDFNFTWADKPSYSDTEWEELQSQVRELVKEFLAKGVTVEAFHAERVSTHMEAP